MLSYKIKPEGFSQININGVMELKVAKGKKTQLLDTLKANSIYYTSDFHQQNVNDLCY